MPNKRKDYSHLLNIKYKRLLPIEIVFKTEIDRPNRAYFKCKCDCGNEKLISCSNFNGGTIYSCGCISIENKKYINRIDGRTKLSEYKICKGIKDRCNNPNNKAYKHYGGRGITMCERWKNDFVNFIEDMGIREDTSLSIERINNDGNYEPGNCKWATIREQSINKRSTRLLTINNETMSVVQWAEKTGMKANTIICRLRSNWPIDERLIDTNKGKPGPKTIIK